MSITLTVLLFPLTITILFFIIVSFSAIYHIFKFEFFNLITLIALVIFGLGTLTIMATSLNHINKIDWDRRISLEELTSRQAPTLNFTNPITY